MEARVQVDKLPGDDGAVALHGLVQDAVQARVRFGVLVHCHPMCFVEWEATMKDRVLQMVPANYLSFNKFKLQLILILTNVCRNT